MNDEEQKKMQEHNTEVEKRRLEKANAPKAHREKQKERKRH